MMRKISQADARRFTSFPAVRRTLLASAVLSVLTAPASYAFNIDTGNPDLRVRWDNTFKYSTAFRVESRDPNLLGADVPWFPNQDDSDRNFDPGLISNRLDVLSEMDFVYKRHYGFRISAAGWYDSVYNSKNDNDSPSTYNNVSVPNNEFVHKVRTLHGRDAELLDAFVFGKFSVADKPVTFRLGRHTVVYGESLFFGANGIADAQAPIDVIKARSVPNTQFKELMRPVNQLSGQVQITPDVALGGYYQLEWEPSRLPGTGSYFSGMDSSGPGAERTLLNADGTVYMGRIADMRAKDSGQFGLKLRYRGEYTDYGLYAVRYHMKTPLTLSLPGADAGPTAYGMQAGEFRFIYPEGIEAVGASASTTLGNVNVAGEISFRHNMPLGSQGLKDPSGTSNNSDNPVYAVGNTAHANLNWMASLGPNFLSQESSFLGEIAWNRALSVTKNRAILNPNSTRDAANIRMVYKPTYRQVMPGLDLSVPVGLGYGLYGNSSVVVGPFLGEHVGDMNIGLSGTYLDKWNFGVTYNHFFGPADNVLDSSLNYSYKQTLADRDFISASIHRTF